MKTRQLVLASYNKHKLEEFRKMMPAQIQLNSLLDIGFEMDIPEPYDSFEANALAKTSFVFERTGLPCFADDSGLVIDALAGRPGVHSARYAGEGCTIMSNITKVLDELTSHHDRTARFVAVIAYQSSVKDTFLFKGTVEGSISLQFEGAGGFGYDPIFVPSGFDKTFAQLPSLLKHHISHRARALHLFLQFLKEHG